MLHKKLKRIYYYFFVYWYWTVKSSTPELPGDSPFGLANQETDIPASPSLITMSCVNIHRRWAMNENSRLSRLRLYWFSWALYCVLSVCVSCVSLAHKNRGITANGTMGCVASKSIAVIRHSLAASCSFCASNTTPNTCLKWNYTASNLKAGFHCAKPELAPPPRPSDKLKQRNNEQFRFSVLMLMARWFLVKPAW